MKKIITLLTVFLIFTSVNYAQLTKKVNPFIGTGGKGHTYPGATVPFGMVQMSPDNGIPGWDEISGYHYKHQIIASFSHTHLSGTGIGDLYDIAYTPFIKSKIKNRKAPDSLNIVNKYYSYFSHEDEYAEPGYYSVLLKDFNIKVELTATERCGFQKYIFPKNEEKTIFLDLARAINWDSTIKTDIQVINDRTIAGFRYSSGWAPDQRVYFVTKFSGKFDDIKFVQKSFGQNNSKNNSQAFIKFNSESKKTILLKTAISSVSIEGARKNLEAEIPHWDFDKVRNEASKKWEKQLSKIKIDARNDQIKTVFYTALYQSMCAPTIFSDVDGKYKGGDGSERTAEGYTNYSTFSLWDTFRATHPLYTIMHPRKVNHMVKSFLAHYKETGLLPVWELTGNETNCMLGYHSVPVIVDAYNKGLLNDISTELLLEAMKSSAMQDTFGLKDYREYGYSPADLKHNSVSHTLEYAFDDWCIAQFAKSIGKNDDFKYFIKRAGFYKNQFDQESKFMRGRFSDGSWIKPFNPDYYTKEYMESNAWHYFTFVPQDIKGLINLYGSNETFVKYIDSLFTHSPSEEDELPIFSTGMIGQYVHGNEPSHHSGYLYNYAGKPWKTQKIIRKIMDTLHKNSPDGICGNEDCGQMSAWFIFSALGFYPVNPAEGIYVIGSPNIDEAKIKLNNGKSFKIRVLNNSDENVYIEKVFLNGKPLEKSFITHKQITKGGILEFQMSKTPNKNWATEYINLPPSMSN